MSETIAAIATPIGNAGIGKIRISGPDAYDIGDLIFEGVKNKSFKEVKTYTVHYGFIIDPEKKKKIDEVIAIVMKKPYSFTGEDVLEFDCHGGKIPLQKILNIILNNGARMAEPGEFSKRAFLNGRIDLSQAEAIIEIINSKTEKSLDIAVNHLTGKLSEKISYIKNQVVEFLAHLEASIDFPEDEIKGFSAENIGSRINNIEKEIKKLLSTGKQGKIYREGINTVIVGKPNVGKSSLLNYLLSEKRAIVTEIPGTTRDIIEEYINLKGIPLKIVDTAGIRNTEDKVEKIGVEKTRQSLEKADLVIMLLDVSQGLTSEDFEVYNLIKGKQAIIVINKTDLSDKLDKNKIKNKFSEHPIIYASIKKEEGLEKLKKAIIEEIFTEDLKTDQDIFITSIRHHNALKKALESIKNVKKSYQNNMPNDFLTIDLKECLDNLGKITGETVTDDIIDRIFSDFCIGK